MNVINISGINANWKWLKDEFHQIDLNWLNYSSRTVPEFIPKHESIGRAISGLHATTKARISDSVLVSHGPRATMYTGSFAKAICPDVPHLAFSFSFTELPKGLQQRVMTKAFKNPTKFVCYSTFERQLYADYFDIPIESIDMIYWSVHAPKFNLDEKPIVDGRYVCALGTEGRDYKTLFAAMKRLPNIKLVVVATAKSIEGLDLPNNVKLLSNIPLSDAFNILRFSEFMILPLVDSKVPCGHSTIVSSMFFKKTVLITNAETVYDYIQNGSTGIFFELRDVDDLMKKIESLWDDSTKTILMNEAAHIFAITNCTEKTAVNYFSNFLKTYTDI